jgi:hypothetical protein
MIKQNDSFLTPTGFIVTVDTINEHGLVTLKGEQGRLRVWFLRHKCIKL